MHIAHTLSTTRAYVVVLCVTHLRELHLADVDIHLYQVVLPSHLKHCVQYCAKVLRVRDKFVVLRRMISFLIHRVSEGVVALLVVLDHLRQDFNEFVLAELHHVALNGGTCEFLAG